MLILLLLGRLSGLLGSSISVEILVITLSSMLWLRLSLGRLLLWRWLLVLLLLVGWQRGRLRR
jgi:hypothetical protein